jgi:hypothetical protein
MSDTTESTSLAKPEEDFDTRIANSVTSLASLADELDEELGIKVMELAQLTKPGIKGMEGEQRVKIPQIFLRQPSSSSEVIPEDCKIGHLYDSNGNNIGESYTFIPVLLHDVRKKWGEEQVDCQSLDGITGTRYGACSECPYGRFEQGARPDCSKGFSFYGVTEDLSAFYRIDFSKSSAKAGRNIKRLIQAPALWSRSFKVTTEKKSAHSRNYYVLKTQATGIRTDDETMRVCDALHGFFQSVYHRQLHGQTAYAKRLAADPSTGPTEAVTVSDDEETIDFSENL